MRAGRVHRAHHRALLLLALLLGDLGELGAGDHVPAQLRQLLVRLLAKLAGVQVEGRAGGDGELLGGGDGGQGAGAGGHVPGVVGARRRHRHRLHAVQDGGGGGGPRRGRTLLNTENVFYIYFPSNENLDDTKIFKSRLRFQESRVLAK